MNDTRTELLVSIEAELRRLGVLQGPIEAPVEVRSAFGMNEMPFEQWLARVFLPRALEASSSGAWPAQSQVAVMAARNFDGQPEMGSLVRLLAEFDAQVNRAPR